MPANDLENSTMAGSNIIDLNPELLSAAAESKAWPFEEAKKIVERYKGADFPDTILFETGYITNEADRGLLGSAEGRATVGEAVARAIEIHFAKRFAAR